MSLIVEPTLPYTVSQLRTEDPERWSYLFPLIRPSIKLAKSESGRIILIDTSFTESKTVLIAAIGFAGNISSKVLSGPYAAGFVLEPFGNPETSAKDIVTVFKDNGFPTENGVVIIRAALKQDLLVNSGSNVVEIDLVGELKVNHVLSLLASCTLKTKSSFEYTKSLLEHFLKSAARTTSKFHEKKSGDAPSVIHALGIEWFDSAKASVEQDLHHLLGSRPVRPDDLVYSVHFADVNGLSRLEDSILAHEISQYLERRKLHSHISQSTILDNQFLARGWAISLCPVPKQYLAPKSRPPGKLPISTTDPKKAIGEDESSKIRFDDSKIRKIITSGCRSVIEAEPTITEYDTIVGDGDCGYTLRDGAKKVLSFIEKADLSDPAAALSDLVDELEISMGGTSGALYCIFISSVSQNLRQAKNFQDALQASLDHLLTFTSARLGDRTCLDCLMPFMETLHATGDARAALEEASKGVETTKTLEAKLGRSSYLDEASTRGVPDPGAWGLLKLLEGMVGAV